MDNNNWSRTVLEIYNYLPRVTYAYDKIIKTRAYNSANMSSNNLGFNNVENVTNSIINLSQRKVTLINLKLIIEKALKSMDKELAKIIIFKFIDKKKSVEIAEKLDVCLRTMFRKVNLALDSFSKALQRMGYSQEKLKGMLNKEKWICKVYETISKKDECEIETFEFRQQIKSDIIFEFRRVAGMC